MSSPNVYPKTAAPLPRHWAALLWTATFLLSPGPAPAAAGTHAQFKEEHRALKVLVLNGHPKLYERLIEAIGDRVDSLIHYHLVLATH